MHNNRKKIHFIALAGAGILFVACLAFIFHKRKDDPLSTVLTDGKSGFEVEFDWGPLPSLPPQRPLPSLSPSLSPAADTSATTIAKIPIPTPTLTADPTVLYLRKVPFLSGQLEIGVVDTDRVFTFHPPDSDSPEARAKAILAIQRATASCARAHRCGLVFDISGHSLNGIPVVLNAAEPLDLTDEVNLQLGR